MLQRHEKKLHSWIKVMDTNQLDKFRADLIDLLLKWQANLIDDNQVMINAEAIDEQLINKILPKTNHHSITIETASLLALLYHNCVLKEDITNILKFLTTKKGEEESAWLAWQKHLDSINWQEREKIVTERYFNNAPD